MNDNSLRLQKLKEEKIRRQRDMEEKREKERQKKELGICIKIQSYPILSIDDTLLSLIFYFLLIEIQKEKTRKREEAIRKRKEEVGVHFDDDYSCNYLANAFALYYQRLLKQKKALEEKKKEEEERRIAKEQKRRQEEKIREVLCDIFVLYGLEILKMM